MSQNDPSERLVQALGKLTNELKRYNDAHDEPVARVAREAELFLAQSEEEVAARELHESLKDLETLNAKDRLERAPRQRQRSR